MGKFKVFNKNDKFIDRIIYNFNYNIGKIDYTDVYSMNLSKYNLKNASFLDNVDGYEIVFTTFHNGLFRNFKRCIVINKEKGGAILWI